MSTATEDHVTLYTSTGLSVSLDLTPRLVTRCRIHEAENYGATCELTIVNDLDSAGTNILSSSFTGWYDPSTGWTEGWSDGGTRGLATGMVVQVRKGSSSGTVLGTFMVMSISASEDLVTLSCGDFIQIMRATGSEYYRNHYLGGGEVSTRERGAISLGSNTIVIDRPADVTLVGGGAGDVLYMAPNVQSYTASPTSMSGGNKATSTIRISTDPDYDRIDGKVGLEYIKVTLRSITEGLGPVTTDYTIKLYAGMYSANTLLQTWYVSCSVTTDTEYTLNLSDSNKDLSEYGYLRIEIEGEYNGQYGITAYVGTYRVVSSDSDLVSVSTTWGNSTYSGYILYCTMGWLKYANASGNNTTDAQSNPVFEITSIAGVSQIDSSLRTSGMDRAWISYQAPESNISKVTVMRDILRAVPPIDESRSITHVSTDRMVNMFRCGGDSYHSYFLALADMEDSDGYQHAFAVVPGTWDSIRVGRRYKPDDASQRTLKYGGQSGTGLDMMSFSPSISKRNRPFLATARGKRNDGTPLIVTVRDPDVAIGPTASVIGSSESSDADIAFQAYSQIMTNRSTKWEGTVELSGIYDSFMAKGNSATFIGGVPVTVNDSRYGMSGYRAKVKEVTLDFQNQKTILVLNNYTESYANDILDSSKMAYQAGNLAVAATAEELYTRQYVFVETSQTLPTAGSYTVTANINGGGTATVPATVIKYPELGVATVVAYFPAGVNYSNVQYSVLSVKVNSGSWIGISQSVRPDKKRQQYLIVNVQMTL